MIRIRILRKGEEILGLESSGHASKMHGSKGENLLCAAVGVLVQTLYLHLHQEGFTEEAAIGDGLLNFKIRSERKKDPIVLTSFALIRSGLENLKEQYPSEIELIGE
ncbi:ribosomal-processing cysteine protease Prp [Leptospira langatensis]|uniref:Ribosomal processing cysteine protease Prp n=1 Tax=Leptospira langatensis TaxID=2484983 RepID=A0A5F1ZTJ6_9LEPT|nr:ribosomal-processing cysteine protease Prp [Leptospira langatensis]TGK00183.1 ribosomal-processing cysteine protease Prp [Leptospira langatensis]TGL41187.1 ribosomal-processing cysteine protease Prp [Leptospira langatensis]